MKRTKHTKKSDEWRRKVLIDTGKRLDARRKLISLKPPNRKHFFEKLYDQSNTISFKVDSNPERFYGISNQVLDLGFSSTALGIYIALCCMSDFRREKKLQISIENVGKLSGLSDWTTISKGINELISEGVIDGEKINRQRRFWIYEVHFVHAGIMDGYNYSDWFPFHSCIVETGTWAKLKPKAQHLYLVLRANANFQYSTSSDYHYDYLNGETSYKKIYKRRKYDTYRNTWTELSKASNIHASYLRTCINQLKRHGLVAVADWASFCLLNVAFRPALTEELFNNSFESEFLDI